MSNAEHPYSWACSFLYKLLHSAASGPILRLARLFWCGPRFSLRSCSVVIPEDCFGFGERSGGPRTHGADDEVYESVTVLEGNLLKSATDLKLEQKYAFNNLAYLMHYVTEIDRNLWLNCDKISKALYVYSLFCTFSACNELLPAVLSNKRRWTWFKLVCNLHSHCSTLRSEYSH